MSINYYILYYNISNKNYRKTIHIEQIINDFSNVILKRKYILNSYQDYMQINIKNYLEIVDFEICSTGRFETTK